MWNNDNHNTYVKMILLKSTTHEHWIEKENWKCKSNKEYGEKKNYKIPWKILAINRWNKNVNGSNGRRKILIYSLNFYHNPSYHSLSVNFSFSSLFWFLTLKQAMNIMIAILQMECCLHKAVEHFNFIFQNPGLQVFPSCHCSTIPWQEKCTQECHSKVWTLLFT